MKVWRLVTSVEEEDGSVQVEGYECEDYADLERSLRRKALASDAFFRRVRVTHGDKEIVAVENVTVDQLLSALGSMAS